MVRCSVLGCKSDSSQKILGLTFHKFPLNRIVQKHWITATGRKGWIPNDTSRICGKHFDDSHKIRKGKQSFIRRGAVPFMNEDKKPLETEDQIVTEAILPITLMKNSDNSPLKNLRVCCMNLPSTSSGPDITDHHYSFADNTVETEASVKLDEQQCDDVTYDEKDLCCCCLRETSDVPLYSSVERGTTERYADMLQEGFGITIDASLRAHATICMECIIQVTEGTKFKRHMLRCHSAILNASEPVQVKQEATGDIKRESVDDFADENEQQTNFLNQTKDIHREHNTYLQENKRFLRGGVYLKEGSSDTNKQEIDEQIKADDRFLQIGCRCPLDCVSNFRHNDIRSFKMLCKQLNEYCTHNTNHLDIFLLGALACLYKKNPNVTANNQKSETTVGYKFEGTEVCHDFFLYTYNVQKKQYDSVFKRIVGVTRGFVEESNTNLLHTELDIKEEVIEWG